MISMMSIRWFFNTPKEKEFKDLSKDKFLSEVYDLELIFNFKRANFNLPLTDKIVDIGVIDNRHWYLTEYGIVCYAKDMYGYLGKTTLMYNGCKDISYNNKIANIKTYFLPYSQIRKNEQVHVWFLNHEDKPTLKDAALIYKNETEEAISYWRDASLEPLNETEYKRRISPDCFAGMFIDENRKIIMLQQANLITHKYHFIDWLPVKEFTYIRGLIGSGYI